MLATQQLALFDDIQLLPHADDRLEAMLEEWEASQRPDLTTSQTQTGSWAGHSAMGERLP